MIKNNRQYRLPSYQEVMPEDKGTATRLPSFDEVMSEAPSKKKEDFPLLYNRSKTSPISANQRQPNSANGTENILSSQSGLAIDETVNNVATKPAIDKIAEIAKQQADVSTEFINSDTPDYLNPTQPVNKINDVLAGNPDAIVDVVAQQQQKLQQDKINLNQKYSGANSKDLPSFYISYKAEQDAFDEQQKELLKIASTALDKVYADKFELSPDKSANVQTSLGEELRKQKAKIGADIAYSDQKLLSGKQQVARIQELLPGFGKAPEGDIKPIGKIVKIHGVTPFGNPEDNAKYNEEFDFTNRASILNAVADNQHEKVTKLINQPVVQKYINGSEDERIKLENDPTVISALAANNDLNEINTQRTNLINQYPQVKAEAQSQQVASLFADYIKKARSGEYGGAEELFAARNIFEGTKLNQDYEIKRVVELSKGTLTEDEVRKYANDATIPSYVGLTFRGFGDVIKDTEQGLNRLTETSKDAARQNRLIEETKYHTPAVLQLSSSNINSDAILSTMFSTVGQIAAYGLEGYLGGELAGAATGLTEVSNIARTDLAALNTAEQVLPANKLATLMVNMGRAKAEGEALTDIVNTTAKAKNISGTFSSMYAASYENAYQQAAKFTDDESKRKDYANSMATANGLAMTILNPANLISKSLTNITKNEVAANFLKTEVPITSKSVLKDRLAEIGKTTGLGVAQSLIPIINDNIAKSRIFDYHTSTTEFFKEALSSSLNMAVGILPFGILGASKVPTSDYFKSSLFSVGDQPDLIKSNIEQSFNKGDITQDEMNRQTAIVNTLSDLVKTVPDKNNEGKLLSQKEKNNLVYLQIQNGALRKKMETASEDLKDHYQQEIDQNKASITNIMSIPEQPAITPERIAKPIEKVSELTPEQVIIQEADKGTLAGGYSDLVKADPQKAKDVLLDYATQKYGLTQDGKDLKGGGREITNPEVDKAVTQAFPDKESVIAAIKPEVLVKSHVPQVEPSDETKNVLNKVNNADYINEHEIGNAENELYDILDKNPNAAHLIEPLILKLQNYEFTTKTETGTIAEKVPTGRTAKTKIEIKPILEQSTGQPVSVTNDKGQTVKGVLRVENGNYIVSDENGNKVSAIGEKAINDRDLKLPSTEEMDNPIQFDNYGNVKSVTVKTKSGSLLTIENPEKALDIAIQLQADALGEIPDEAFQPIYDEVQKTVTKEVPKYPEKLGSSEPIKVKNETTQQSGTSNKPITPEAQSTPNTATTEAIPAAGEGTGEPPPGQTAVEELKPEGTGIAHAATEETRKKFGLKEYERNNATDAELQAKADEVLKAGYDPETLIRQMEAGNPPTGVENFILKKYLATLEAAVEKDPSDKNIAAVERLVKATDKIGSLQSEAFRTRRGIVPVDDSLSGFFIQDIEANNDAPLTDKQKETTKKEFNDISEAQKVYDEKVAALEAENTRLKAEAEVKKTTTKKTTTKRTHEDFVKERRDILDKIKEKWKGAGGDVLSSDIPFRKQLSAIAPDVTRLVKNLIEEGVTKLSDVVAHVHDALKDSIEGISKEDIHNIIAGDYNEKKITKKDAAIKMENLRIEAQLINKLEKILNGEKPTTEKQTIKRNQEIEDLRKKIEEATKEQLESNKFHGEKIEEGAKQLESLRKKNEKETAAIKEKITKNDFSVEEKKTPILEDKNLKEKYPKLFKEAQNSRDELIKAKRERAIRLLKQAYANKKPTEKAIEVFSKTLNIPRTLMASMDFSAPLRQAVVATAAHPILASKALEFMLKASISEKEYNRWLDDVHNSERWKIAEKTNLAITDPSSLHVKEKEEAFQGAQYPEMIPIIGEGVKASERAYIGYLNHLRWNLFNMYADRFEEQGKTYDNNKKLYEGLSSFINSATGRGNMKGLEAAAPILNWFLFASRLIASRLNMLGLTDVPNLAVRAATLGKYGLAYGFYSKLPPELRIEAAKDMLKFIAIGMATLLITKGISNATGGNIEIETDPRSSDFGKIKSGNTRWDIWGGFQPYARVLTQTITGERKATTTGKIYQLNGKGFMGETRMSPLATFAREKLAPVPSTVINLVTGRDAVGQSVTIEGQLVQDVTPLIISDVYQAMKDQGVKALFTVGIPSAFGVGVQSYQPKKKK